VPPPTSPQVILWRMFLGMMAALWDLRGMNSSSPAPILPLPRTPRQAHPVTAGPIPCLVVRLVRVRFLPPTALLQHRALHRREDRQITSQSFSSSSLHPSVFPRTGFQRPATRVSCSS